MSFRTNRSGAISRRAILTYLVPTAVLILLVAGNLTLWSYSRDLAATLARRQNQFVAKELALRIQNLFFERTKDLTHLANLWQNSPEHLRKEFFLRDARGIVEREPQYLFIKYFDAKGMPVLSAVSPVHPSEPPLPSQEKIRRMLRLTELSDEPVATPARQLKDDRLVVCIHVPLKVKSGAEKKYTGCIGGQFLIADIFRTIVSSSEHPEFVVRIFEDGAEIFNSAPEQSPPSSIDRFLASHVFSTLGRAWRVVVFPRSDSTLAHLPRENNIRLLVNLSVSLLTSALLFFFLLALEKTVESRAELAHAAEKHALAVRAGRTAAWEIEPLTRKITADDDLNELLGWGPEATDVLIDDWLSLVHPEDRPNAAQRLDELVRGEVSACSFEFRAIRKEGGFAWCWMKGGRVQSSEKQPERIVGTCTDVTWRRQAEEAQRKSDENYRLVVENASESIMIIRGETPVFFNRRTLELTGYTEEEFRNASLFDLIHPDDRERIRDNYLRRLQGLSVPSSNRFRFIDREGRNRWAIVNSVLIKVEGRPATLNFFYDITEQHLAALALAESEDRYRSIFDNEHSVMLLTDPVDGNVVDANPAAVRFYGFSKEVLLKMKLADLTEPDAGGGQGAGEGGQVRHRTKSGLVREVEMFSGPITAGGRKLILSVVQDVTESRRAQAAYLEARDYAHNIVQSSLDMIVALDMERRIVEFNRAASQTFGYESEEITGRLVDSLFATPGTGRTVAEVILEKGVFVGETKNVRQNGEVFPCRLSASVLRNYKGQAVGTVCIFRDITLERKARAALEESEEKYRTLLETISEGFCLVDEQTRLTYVNQGLAGILGYERSEFIGRSITDFIDPDQVSPWRDRFAQRQKGQSEQYELTMRRKDGKQVFTLVSAQPVMDREGKFRGSMAAITDITRLKMIEGQLVQAQRLEAIGHLAAGIAHEINTPMQYIRSNIEYLSGEFDRNNEILGEISRICAELAEAFPDNPQAAACRDRCAGINQAKADALDAIRGALEGVERVGKIVSSMRYFAHPGREKKSDLDINQAVENAVIISQYEWQQWADLEMELAPDLPVIQGYPAEFNQALLNLIINAAQAIAGENRPGNKPQGLIEITSRRDGDWAEIRVADNGPGIPAHVKPRIFDPFFTTKEVGQGTGQGLSMAYSSIVDRHGGKIEADENQGGGALFIVRLPIKQVPVGSP